MSATPTDPPRRMALAATRREATAMLASLALSAPALARPRRQSRTRFGVNCYDLFLNDPRSAGAGGLRRLDTLGRLGIPFVRFPASGQWAGDWQRYEADPRDWWQRMDAVFAAAEQAGVGLVPSVFWQPVALPFHLGEPVRAWADPASRTRAFAAHYTGIMAERYDRSPALLIWEFGNELNDWVDLPNVLQFWPRRDPTMPGRAGTDADRLSSGDLRAAVDAFAETVRRTGRKPVGMGSNLPRGNAWHLARGSWDRDSPDQFVEQLRRLTPAACDVLSIHLYPGHWGKPGDPFAGPGPVLAAFVEAAAADRRISFVGEFGIPRMPDRAAERRAFADMMQAIGGSGVRYAALWDFDRTLPDPQWNVTTTNDRSYQLDALVEANRAHG